MSKLIPIENVDPKAVFVGNELDCLLEKIKAAALADAKSETVETVSGRKEIASRAYAVSRSKTAIDDAGKQLVADQKREIKKVDAARKRARDTLDALRDEVRKPLSDWEGEQARIEEEKRLEAERIERERLEVEERERQQREAELAERERKVREAEAEQRRREQDEVRRVQEAERQERERVEAEARAKRQEEERVRREKEAAERADREKAEAVERARQEERKAAERREEEAQRAKDAEVARLREIEQNKAIRTKVHLAIKAAFVEKGLSDDDAQSAMELIAGGFVPGVSINYSVLT